MERRVEYATSSDGTSIAYWTLGDGKPLVYMSGGPWNHVELWELDECQRWYEQLARDRRLVRYDVRGTGRSQRSVSDHSLNAQLADLEAIVDQLKLPTFDLFAATNAVPAALTFVAKHPGRVRRLVLWCGWARNFDIEASPRIRAWMGLLDEDWELMTETCAHLALGWSAGEVGRSAARYLRENVSQEDIRRAFVASSQQDATDVLPNVNTPALILHRREIPWLPLSVAHELAAGLPNARLTFLDGESTAPYMGSDEVVVAIDAFLNSTGSDMTTMDGPIVDSGGLSGTDDGLSEREREVLRLLAGGGTNQEIADELVLSVRTVERHVQNAYGKIGARRRAEATAYAIARGIV